MCRRNHQDRSSRLPHDSRRHVLPVGLIEQLLGGSEYHQVGVEILCGPDDRRRGILAFEVHRFGLDVTTAEGGQDRIGDVGPSFVHISRDDAVFFGGPRRGAVGERVPLLGSDLVEEGAWYLDDRHDEGDAVAIADELGDETGDWFRSEHASRGDEDPHRPKTIDTPLGTLRVRGRVDDVKVFDETVNRILWSIPNVLCLVGSRSGEEWNAMTASWVTQIAMEPVLVAVGIDKKALTHRLIGEGGSFTINLWDRADTRPFVKFSKPASKVDMALNERPIREGATGAPVFEEAVAYLDCAVWKAVDCGSHTLFIGEVADCGFQNDGENMAVARMEDTRMKYGGVRRGAH